MKISAEEFLIYITLKLELISTAKKMGEDRSIREEQARKTGQKYLVQIIDLIRAVKSQYIKDRLNHCLDKPTHALLKDMTAC